MLKLEHRARKDIKVIREKKEIRGTKEIKEIRDIKVTKVLLEDQCHGLGNGIRELHTM